MKRLVFGLALLGVVFFSGCANKVHEYSVSTNNVLKLQGLSKNNKDINLGEFTDSGRDEAKVMCRLATPIGTPSGETFASYIKNAFAKELLTAGMYNPSSDVTISMNIDSLYGSTTLGNAYWEFEVTLKSSNGKTMKVKSRYDYESSFSAMSACSEMQRSFVLAVQKLIGDIVNSPEFAELIKK
jgi:hypothetical protein